MITYLCSAQGFAEETGTRRRRRSRVASQTPLKPPTQEELAQQKKQEAHARRVRQSLKKYLRRKREALKPKVEAAKKCAGCSLEVFDEDTNTWKHMRVNRVEVKWLEGGTIRRPLLLGLVAIARGRGWSFFGFRGRSRAGVTCRIRYEVQPVDDMERMSGPPYWLDLDECRYYISQRVAPDPETRKIWEHNEAEAAIV